MRRYSWHLEQRQNETSFLPFALKERRHVSSRAVIKEEIVLMRICPRSCSRQNGVFCLNVLHTLCCSKKPYY